MVQMVTVGYRIQTERETDGEPNGVFDNDVVERTYIAKCVHSVQRSYDGEQTINETKKLTLDVSIVSNSFMESHLQDIAYIAVAGSKWQIQSIEMKSPRYIFNLGGAYRG